MTDELLGRLILAAFILLGGASMPIDLGPTSSAWDRNLGNEHKFALRVLARLPEGEVLRTHSKNPVRSRMILTQLAEMGLAEEPTAHAWRPTFKGRRVAKMLRLEEAHAGNPA